MSSGSRPARERDILFGSLVVGIEDTAPDDEAFLKVYIEHRSYGRYVLIYDEVAAAQVRDAWAGMRPFGIPYVPDDALHHDEGGH